MAKRLVNKSAFVREQPLSMTAREVVAAAKAKGITLSDKYVFNIRAKAKAAGKRGPGRPAGRPRKVNGSSSAETAFVDAALDLGLARASELLTRVRQSAHAA